MKRDKNKYEQGMALPLVLLITVCVIMIAFGFLYMFGTRVRLNSIFVNRNSAGYYAEAGIDQYIWNLNQDDHYYATHHTVASSFEAGYYYIEETDPTVADPTVTIRSTGWLAKDPNNKQTIEAKLHKRQFTQYIWCTDIETAPPPELGVQVWWYTGDIVHSRVHTNGILNFLGTPRFNDTVTFSGVTTYTANYFDSGTSYNDPQFYKDGVKSNWQTQCFYEDKLQPKSSNSELITQAQANGYYYPGRTSIYLHDSTETPPRTLMDVCYWDTTKWVWQHNLPLPANGVVYVNGTGDFASVPFNKKFEATPNNVDSSSGLVVKINAGFIPLELDYFNQNRGNVFISGKLRGRLTIAASNSIFICPDDPLHPCDRAYSEKPGLVYGSATYNADGSVTNLGTDDMLGLCADNFVYILHNFWPAYPDTPTSTNVCYCSNNDLDIAPNNIFIHAAIYAMPNGAFTFEDYWLDPQKGKINLFGSISQHFRGVRGRASSHGYSANYSHDERMAYETPPHFLSPANAGWGIVAWRKLPPSASAGYKPIASIDEVYADGHVTTVSKGIDIQMHATVYPDDATIIQGSSDATVPNGLLWTVKNAGGATASINPNTGLLTTGTSQGTVTVSAQAEDVQPGETPATKSVTLNITYKHITSVEVQGPTGMLCNNNITLTTNIEPSDAENKTLQWSFVTNPAAASINPIGDTSTAQLTSPTSLSPSSFPSGTATVTVRAAAADGSGVYDDHSVEIRQQVKNITITGPSTVVINNNYVYTVTVTPTNAAISAVIWSWSISSYPGYNPPNPTLNSTGLNSARLFAGSRRGTIIIKATAADGSGASSTKTVTINNS